MIQNIDIDSLDDKNLIILNQKLPKPKQKIVGSVYTLPITIRLGCRIELTKKYRESISDMLEIDGKKILFGPDSTVEFLKNPNDYYRCFGDGNLRGKYKNHIDCSFFPGFAHLGYLNDHHSIDFYQRRGWCCILHRKDYHRDYVCDLLGSTHLDKFQGNEWFCYSRGHNYKNLFKYMFRLPNHSPNRMWEKFFLQIPSSSNPTNAWRYHYGPWHKQNLIELAVEGTVEYFELSEKTMKPIGAGMPFVVVGCHGFLKSLRKIGFKTFAPYIDESYDDEIDWKIRIQKAMESMFNFLKSKNNLGEVKEICAHNMEILKKIIKHNFPLRPIKKLRRFVSFE